MAEYRYRVLLRREPEGGYTVTVPVLPGCVSYGATVDEACEMAREAIALYIEDLAECTLAAEAHAWGAGALLAGRHPIPAAAGVPARSLPRQPSPLPEPGDPVVR